MTKQPKDIDAKLEKCLWCSGVKTHKEWCLSNYPKPADKQDDKEWKCEFRGGCGETFTTKDELIGHYFAGIGVTASDDNDVEMLMKKLGYDINKTYELYREWEKEQPEEPATEPTPQQSNSVEQIRSLKLWGAITSPDGDGAVGYVTLGEQAIQQLNLLLEAEYRRGYNDNARDCMCDALPMSPHHHLMDDGESRHIKPDIPLTKSKGIEPNE